MNSGIIAWYTQGALTDTRLQSAIDEAMTAIAADEVELRDLGLTRADLAAERFEVKPAGGIIVEGILLAIAVGAAGNLSADVTKALWAKVLKRVKTEKGDDAIGPEQQPRRDGDGE